METMQVRRQWNNLGKSGKKIYMSTYNVVSENAFANRKLKNIIEQIKQKICHQ